MYIQRTPREAPVDSVVARCRSIHAAVPDADNTISSSLKNKEYLRRKKGYCCCSLW